MNSPLIFVDELQIFIESNKSLIRSMATRKRCPHSDIDDIVQEVSLSFLDYSRRHGKMPSEGEVIHIIRSRIADFFRKQSRSPLWRSEQVDESQVRITEVNRVHFTPSLKSLNRFLKPLKSRAKEIFLRRSAGRETISEIARCFDMTSDGVKSSLRRSRERLQVHVKQLSGKK